MILGSVTTSGQFKGRGAISSPDQCRIPVEIPASTFGKYTLVARLGSGGMAEVFLGGKRRNDVLVAPAVIKRMFADLAQDAESLQMFRDEAQLAKRLEHLHVVGTYEVGEVRNQHYIALEYLEGQPLSCVIRRALAQGRALSMVTATEIAVQALEGLAYAHQLSDEAGKPLGIVHRDVSPQNIFVTYDGVVKLLDFGVAKATTHLFETRTGAIKGKYGYMSPEQGRGEKVDRRCDIWAMGVCFWETLTGRRLFKGGNEFETMRLVMDDPIPRLSVHLPKCPAELDRIVHRALERDPALRYQSAETMKEDLVQFLDHQGSSPSLMSVMASLYADEIENHRAIRNIFSEDEDSKLDEKEEPSSFEKKSSSISQVLSPLTKQRDKTPYVKSIGVLLLLLFGVFWTTQKIQSCASLEEQSEVNFENSSQNEEKKRGYLTIHSQPVAEVFHNVEKLGKTPLENHELKPGHYILTLRNASKSIEKNIEVTILAGENTEHSINLLEDENTP